MEKEKIIITLALIFIIFMLAKTSNFRKRRRIKRKIKKLAKNKEEMSPEEFFNFRKKKDKGREYISNKYNFSGVYILYNYTKNMYYVGQAQKIFSRVNSHFTGSGNGDVYADYKYGDKFGIKMISLKESRYKNLNDLERNTIFAYSAYSKGYNKTIGNK